MSAKTCLSKEPRSKLNQLNMFVLSCFSFAEEASRVFVNVLIFFYKHFKKSIKENLYVSNINCSSTTK